jgi:hypothetical protein
MTPDSVEYYTVEELHTEFNITFTEDGWYQRGKDIVLITRDGDKLCAMFWNDRDPRPGWRKALSLPFYKIEGGDLINKEEGWLPPMDEGELKPKQSDGSSPI